VLCIFIASQQEARIKVLGLIRQLGRQQASETCRAGGLFPQNANETFHCSQLVSFEHGLFHVGDGRIVQFGLVQAICLELVVQGGRGIQGLPGPARNASTFIIDHSEAET